MDSVVFLWLAQKGAIIGYYLHERSLLSKRAVSASSVGSASRMHGSDSWVSKKHLPVDSHAGQTHE